MEAGFACDRLRPLVLAEPAGVSTFWLLSAAKMSYGLTPSVARPSCENSTYIRSACSPMMPRRLCETSRCSDGR